MKDRNDPKIGSLDASVEMLLGDYELLDFAAGRKLECWGEYTVEYPERLSVGEPADQNVRNLFAGGGYVTAQALPALHGKT
jgi:hypothetical protein